MNAIIAVWHSRGRDLRGRGVVQPLDKGQDHGEARFLASASANNRLQNAITDSDKDKLREAMSLNAIKQKFVTRGSIDDANRVKRMQNMTDRPFRRINGAAAFLDEFVFAKAS